MKRRFAIVALLLVGWTACKEERSCPSVAQPKGFSLSPVGFPRSYDRLGEFFLDIRNLPGSGVLWNGSWRDDAEQGTNAGSVPKAATTLLQQGEMDCFHASVVFGWRSGSELHLRVPEDATNSWANQTAQLRFREMLRNFVAVHRPSVVFLGNENDFYYEKDPLDYFRWIAFYNLAYDDIKTIHPGTSVGPVFNFEHLSGGGTLNGWTRPLWEALSQHDFDRVDVVGVTVYPFFQHPTAGEIPSGYLDPLVAQVRGKPIAITETGWPAENLGGFVPPWVASDLEQTAYIPKLAAMISGKNVLFQNWLFFNAMVDDGTSSQAWKTFGSVSLRDEAGLKRPAYDVWDTMFQLR
jgi:hypothetical protein